MNYMREVCGQNTGYFLLLNLVVHIYIHIYIYNKKKGKAVPLQERDHLGDLGVDGWIILGWISRKWDVGIWTGYGRVADAYECGNEPSSSVKCGEFLD